VILMGELIERRMQRIPAPASVLAVGVFVLFVGIGSACLAGSAESDQKSDGDEMTMAVAGQPLPGYVVAAGMEAEIAYTFAVERPDVMQWMVCYCGCGEHTGHKSAFNCFVEEGGSEFDPHGADCQMCINIALDAKAMTEDGHSLKSIRAYIDGKYGAIGPGTDTPLPPA
jgi:hypothetical protein